jgi:nucleoside 2-deoxyribosyltransferase
MAPGTCPLCDRPVDEVDPNVGGRAIHRYDCRTCGAFLISPEAARYLQGNLDWHERRWVLSGVTRRASDNGSPVELLTRSIEEVASFAQIPRTPFEALDRLMLLLASRVRDIGGETYLDPDRDYPLVFASGRGQMDWLCRKLRTLGYLGNGAAPNPKVIGLAFTLKGWERIEQLQRTSPDSDQAFVAMWFAPEMAAVFAEGMRPALKATGYDAFRVDLRAHNDKIDDRIVSEIRRSGLLVADFTGQRGGVYWEAGFAQGLGIPVIRTCRSDELAHLHFDTRQYLHVGWSTPAELRERLETHIRATIPGRATATERAGSGAA